MVPRVFSLAIASLLSLPAQAQLPSSRGSSINDLGRYYGFGYSDGYHACQDGKCKTSNASSSWKPWEPIAVLHAKPTSPATSRLGKTSSSSISPTYLPHRNGRHSETFKPVQSYSPSPSPSPSPSSIPSSIPIPSPIFSPSPISIPSPSPRPSQGSFPSHSPSFSLDYGPSPVPTPSPIPSPSSSPSSSPIPSPSSRPSPSPSSRPSYSPNYLPAPLSAEPVPQWNRAEPEFNPSQFTHDVRDAKHMVAQAFPNANIDVIVNEDGTLVVRGTTDNEKSAFRIVEFLRKNFLVPVKDEVSVSRK